MITPTFLMDGSAVGLTTATQGIHRSLLVGENGYDFCLLVLGEGKFFDQHLQEKFLRIMASATRAFSRGWRWRHFGLGSQRGTQQADGESGEGSNNFEGSIHGFGELFCRGRPSPTYVSEWIRL